MKKKKKFKQKLLSLKSQHKTFWKDYKSPLKLNSLLLPTGTFIEKGIICHRMIKYSFAAMLTPL